MASADPGLCKRCAASRSLKSGRGSVFWRCSEHDQNPTLPKYPPLPVLRCPLFRECAPDTGAAENKNP